MSNTTFAQAQQRLAERRAQRETASRARIAQMQSESALRANIASNSSPLFRRIGLSALSAWDAISSREGTRPAFRVGQVDAELLDEELVELLRGQVADALRYFGGHGGTLKDEWSAEILLMLRAVLFKITVWDNDATYGAALQNLKYTDARHEGPVLVPPSKFQKSMHGLATVGGKYLWSKWEDWLLAHQDDGYEPPSPRLQRWSRLTSLASNAHAVAAFASFLVFLLHGRYRTLLDRILRMRLAPPTSQVSREVSFEYLNRQLVWHAFTEFLLFVLPLIGISRWRRWFMRTWRKSKDIFTTGGENQDGEGSEKKGEYAFLPERTCAICYQDQNAVTTEAELIVAAASSGVVGSAQTDITNPYETIPCGCIYCFVCLTQRLEQEEGESWTCLRCGTLVKESKPWNGDVMESPTRSSTHKTVGFVDDVEERLSSSGDKTPLVDSDESLVRIVPIPADEVDSGEGQAGSTNGDNSSYDEVENLGDGEEDEGEEEAEELVGSIGDDDDDDDDDDGAEELA